MKPRHGLTADERAEYIALTAWLPGGNLPVLTNAQIARVAELRAKAERACWARVQDDLLPLPRLS